MTMRYEHNPEPLGREAEEIVSKLYPPPVAWLTPGINHFPEVGIDDDVDLNRDANLVTIGVLGYCSGIEENIIAVNFDNTTAGRQLRIAMTESTADWLASALSTLLASRRESDPRRN